MEKEALKLMSQLGLLAVLIWVLAGALGRRGEVTVKQSCPQRNLRRAKGDVWAQNPVVAPGAQGSFAPTLQMGFPR